MYKQAPKSPAMKALVGNQKNLPQALKAQIEASPAKNMNKGYGSPVKKEYSDRGTRLRSRAEKAETRGNEKRAGKLNKKADKYDKKQISGLMGSLEKAGAFERMTPAKMKSPAKQAKEAKSVTPGNVNKLEKGTKSHDAYKNKAELNAQLAKVTKAYQANRNPQTKAALTEAKAMAKEGTILSSVSTKRGVSTRKLGA